MDTSSLWTTKATRLFRKSLVHLRLSKRDDLDCSECLTS